jgi:nitroreductase
MESAGSRSIIETIAARSSCRNYIGSPLAPATLSRVAGIIARGAPGPHGQMPGFRLLEFTPGEGTGRLGTYGFIRNARYVVAGAVLRGDAAARLDYGYCLEWIVLELTRIGLGTCWLGAFDRAKLAQRLGPRADEVVPAIVVLGDPEGHKRVVERLIKLAARSGGRKSWDALFYEASSERPLAPAEAGAYRACLECLRLAPSSRNAQPWRVYADPAAGRFDFYSQGAAYVDLGIAMLHFEVAAVELGLGGQWRLGGTAPRRPGLLHVATWQALT